MDREAAQHGADSPTEQSARPCRSARPRRRRDGERHGRVPDGGAGESTTQLTCTQRAYRKEAERRLTGSLQLHALWHDGIPPRSLCFVKPLVCLMEQLLCRQTGRCRISVKSGNTDAHA